MKRLIGHLGIAAAAIALSPVLMLQGVFGNEKGEGRDLLQAMLGAIGTAILIAVVILIAK